MKNRLERHLTQAVTKKKINTMKKVIKLTESDLRRIVNRVIKEQWEVEKEVEIDFPFLIGNFQKTLPLRDKFADEYTYTYFLNPTDSADQFFDPLDLIGSGKPTRKNPNFSLRYNSVKKKWIVSWSDGGSEEGKKIVAGKSPYLPNGEYDEQKFKKMFDAFKYQQKSTH